MGANCSICQKPSKSKILHDLDFTEEDATLVSLSWDDVVKQHETDELALAFFKKLCEEHPHVRNYFEALAPKADPDRATHYMKIHSITVLSRIATFVVFANRSSILVGLLEKLARSHISKGVAIEDMERFCSVYISLMQDSVSEHYQLTSDVTDAWKRLFARLISIYKLAQEEPGVYLFGH